MSGCATDHALATLLLGGTVHIADGLDLDRTGRLLLSQPVGWLLAMPGMLDPLVDALRPLAGRLIAPRLVGAMADLVPREQIAEPFSWVEGDCDLEITPLASEAQPPPSA